jgi:hypothetical protein
LTFLEFAPAALLVLTLVESFLIYKYKMTIAMIAGNSLVCGVVMRLWEMAEKVDRRGSL